MLRRPLERPETIAKLDEIIGLLKKLLESQEAEYGATPYERGMEYYDYDEQAALQVTTRATAPHEFKERPVKFMWFYARGADIQVSLDNAVTGESMIVPQGAIIWVRKEARRVYGQTLAGTGTLFIWGFW